MSIKKFKSDVRLEQKIIVPSLGSEKAVIINNSNEIVDSSVTQTELERLSGITSALLENNDKGANNGIASLDANGKIPSSQLPALAITEVFVVADITARDALTVGSGDGEVQEGDVAIVTDASADVDVDSGGASYIYDGAAWQRILVPNNLVISVNGETGVVVLDSSDLNHTQANAANWTLATNSTIADHLDEVASRLVDLENAPQTDELLKVSANDTTAGYLEDKIVVSSGSNTTNILEVSTLNDAGDEDLQIQIDQTKIDHDQLLNFVANEHIDHTSVSIATAVDSGLSGGGDITATRDLSVDILGTTAETSADDADSILIYDDSASALKSMTRANFLAGVALGPNDIAQTDFTFANNQAAAVNVTALSFANADVRSFLAELVVERGTLREQYILNGVQLNAGWNMSVEAVGDDSGVVFTINSSGQVQYTSTDDSVGGTFIFKAKTIDK